MMNQVQIVECPRDAMQGWNAQIPTHLKVQYLNALLGVGFHTLDFGSFVSAKAIPQMADTIEVIRQIQWQGSDTKLLAIVANLRGAEEAAIHEGITYIGYPLSVSETFQVKNTGAGIEDSIIGLGKIANCCKKHGKKLVVYLSMAFGNPYGDTYPKTDVTKLAQVAAKAGAEIISLADTVGLAAAEQVYDISREVMLAVPDKTIGIHLHSTREGWKQKVSAAWDAGVRRFDGAIGGYGGCPMAGNILVGNLDTRNLIQFVDEKQIPLNLNMDALESASKIANEIFYQ